MQAYFESIGMLGPVYRMAGQGLTNRQIASKLNVTEIRVESCIAWTMRFLHLTERAQLVTDAAGPLAGVWLRGPSDPARDVVSKNGTNEQQQRKEQRTT